jgi:RNA polymerase sigma factor (TIGR02999 family)
MYSELRRIAAAYLRRERSDHTMQPTALVHEAYLRIVDQKTIDCHSRAQFFGIAANLMRQILVNHAKGHNAVKRGRGNNRVTLDDVGLAATQQAPGVDLVALNEALDRLTELNARQSRIVEMRFFAGLTENEIADLLNISPITVKRDWRTARAFLYQQLGLASHS